MPKAKNLLPPLSKVGAFKRAACEPSSWAGFGAVAIGLKAVFPQYGAILDGVAMLAGTLGVCMREGRYCQDVPPPAGNAG